MRIIHRLHKKSGRTLCKYKKPVTVLNANKIKICYYCQKKFCRMLQRAL